MDRKMDRKIDRKMLAEYTHACILLKELGEIPEKEYEDVKEICRQREEAAEIKEQVEDWMEDIPIRMRRIVKYKFFEGMTWEETAAKIGRKATGDSIRKDFQRFLKRNKSLSALSQTVRR